MRPISARNRRVREPEAGLSLLEMLVVLAILALLATAMPGLGGGLFGGGGAQAQEAAVRSVMGELRRARAEAIRTAEPVAVAFDPLTLRFGREGHAARLPEGTLLTLETAAEAAVGADPAIRFFPDGTATGGTVALALAGRQTRIEVRWLTGAIRRAE